ncbi:MAG: acyltransferase [Lachnospiraceae bacterium]|nr:acyltransferase [Lachnospiraceae bacterium]
MQYILYAVLLVCLFWGAKLCKSKEWNEDVLSYAQTKSFLGFCALIIILHHCSQRTLALWFASGRMVHGLEAFFFLGYLCVAVFFFCSGYGMYTASRRKEGFFIGYYKRFLRILIPAVVMWVTFFLVEQGKGMVIEKPIWINTYDYIWYIPAMIYMYLVFYLSFHLIKNEKAGMAVTIVATSIYFILCMLLSPGTWWYNTPHLFAAGIITARHREKIGSFFKKGYPVWVVISFVVTMAGFIVSNYYYQVISVLGYEYQEVPHFIAELTGQVISAFSFVVFVMLIGMKIKIGNKVLLFLGGFTLEIYLVHPLFVQLFSFAFIQNTVKPLYHIQNPFLYVAAVTAISLPIAFILHRIVEKIIRYPEKRIY